MVLALKSRGAHTTMTIGKNTDDEDEQYYE